MTPLLAWSLVVASALAALHSMPIQPTEPAVTGAAFNAVRLVAIGLGWYLLVAGAAGLVLRLGRRARAVRLADAVTVPAVRALLDRTVGAAVATALTVAVPFAGDVVSPTPAAAEAPASPGSESPASKPPVMRRLPDPATPPVSAAAPASLRTWAVQPGQSFWSVAQHVLAQARGRDVSDAEVVPYWRTLIEHNRHRLRVPSEPGLLFVGQELELPPL